MELKCVRKYTEKYKKKTKCESSIISSNRQYLDPLVKRPCSINWMNGCKIGLEASGSGIISAKLSYSVCSSIVLSVDWCIGKEPSFHRRNPGLTSDREIFVNTLF